MNRDTSRRARAAAAAAPAASSEWEGSLRQGRRDALQALDEDRPLDALGIAEDLTLKHPNSAIAFNLAGTVFEIAGNRAHNLARDIDASELSVADQECLEGLADEMRPYFVSAVKYYWKAALLAPNCAVTAVAHGRMLARCGMIQEAFSEFKRSLRLTSPTNPDSTNPWMFGETTEPGIKKQRAKEMARDEFNLFLGIAESQVYTKCLDIIARHDPSKNTAAVVRREAKDLGASYPFSARAQLLFPFLHRDFVRNLPLRPDIDRSKLYHQVIDKIQSSADIFSASLVISLFRAEILTDVGDQEHAAEECIRGLNIQIPDDPNDQDLPPGSVAGAARDARVETMTERILKLLEQIEDQMAEAVANQQQPIDEHPNAPKPQRKKIPEKVHSKQVKLQVPLDPMSVPPPKDQKEKTKQSVIYRFSRLQKKHVAPEPRPEQIVDGVVVPVETVNIYAEYSRLQSKCSKYKLVCHMCVFYEQDSFTCKFPQADLGWHCIGVHEASGSIECKVDGCFVRFKTDEEAFLHAHYCHCLPKDWWRRW